MSDTQKHNSDQNLTGERRGIPALSALVVEALRARGLDDEAIRAVMKKHRKPRI